MWLTARDQRKHEKELERERVDGEAVAREIADILIAKLSEDEIAKFYEALDHRHLTYGGLREAIAESIDAAGLHLSSPGAAS